MRSLKTEAAKKAASSFLSLIIKMIVVPAKAGTHNHQRKIFDSGGYGSRLALGYRLAWPG
jgi:hypothetical protein